MLAAAANEYFSFTKNKILLPVASIVAFVGMVSTGTILVISTHQGLTGPCIEGLAYLSAIAVVYGSARLIAKHSSRA